MATSLTSSPSTQDTVERETILLDTIPEIVAKKVYHRGSSIRPRDIFDIAAAGESYSVQIINALRPYMAEVARALATINRLNSEFVNGAITQLAIKSRYIPIAQSALEKTVALLRAA